jgi:hypothetical protein
MIKALILPLCRACLQFLRTDKERVGAIERFVRAMILLLPYGGLLGLLRIRLALWGPLTVDGTSFSTSACRQTNTHYRVTCGLATSARRSGSATSRCLSGA